MHLNECLMYGFERKTIVFQYKAQKIKDRESLFISPFQYQTNSITNLKVCKSSSWPGSLHSEGLSEDLVLSSGGLGPTQLMVAIGLWLILCQNPFSCSVL